MARLVSVNVGLPKDVAWDGRTVHTGIWKQPVDGPVMVRRLNIDGDGQGDLAGHGGEQRAVLAYQVQSYRYWERLLGRAEMGPGSFGENLTVDGLPDDEVCVGDRYRVGEAELEVTQPRVTCFRVGMRLGEPRMPALLVGHHRPGFYLRVIAEGRVEAGQEIHLVRRGRHALSVAAVDALLYLPGRDLEELRQAVDVPALSPGWQQSFRELLAAGAGAGPSAVAEAAWPGFRSLVVARVTSESDTVTSFRLESADGEPLPPAEPGQYLTLRVSDGTKPVAVRSYSLSDDPRRGGYRISVKREPHGRVSGFLHDSIRAGMTLDVAAPRGEFVLARGASPAAEARSSLPVLLVSAGVGITSVLSLLHQLVDEGAARPVWWLHTTPSPATRAFAAEVDGLLARLPDVQARTYYTSPDLVAPPPGSVLGHLTAEAIADLGLPADAVAYLCGPVPFMDAITSALRRVGLAESDIRTERFAARSAVNPGVVGQVAVPPHLPPGPPATGPAITFARSDLTANWSPDYDSLLEFAEACDVPTRWSCRSGVCHTCVTPVLSGSTAYTSPPLEPPGPDEVLVCSARPVTDLVLDL